MDYSIYGDMANLALNSFLSFVTPLLIIYFVPQIAWLIIKNAACGLYSFVNIGISKREERKAHKNINTAIDLISNVSDIASVFRTNKK